MKQRREHTTHLGRLDRGGPGVQLHAGQLDRIHGRLLVDAAAPPPSQRHRLILLDPRHSSLDGRLGLPGGLRGAPGQLGPRLERVRVIFLGNDLGEGDGNRTGRERLWQELVQKVVTKEAG